MRLTKRLYPGRIAQLGEHLPYKQGVTGSSPVSPTIVEPWCSRLTHRPVKPEIAGSSPVGSAMSAEIAQSVEQGTENPRVAGSIPALGTREHAEVVQR